MRPRAAGEIVVLQQRLDGTKRWKKSSQGKIRANGRFVLRDEPSTPGVRFYRVLKPASNGTKAGTSRELGLAVWTWERLTDRSIGAYSGIDYGGPQFGTVYYPDSIFNVVAGKPGYVEYTLGRKARSLRASFALTDTSASGATGTVTVTVDGTHLPDPFRPHVERCPCGLCRGRVAGGAHPRVTPGGTQRDRIGRSALGGGAADRATWALCP